MEESKAGLGSGDFEALRCLALKVMAQTDALLSAPEALTARDLKATCALLLDVRNLLGLAPPETQTQSLEVRFVDTEGAEI